MLIEQDLEILKRYKNLFQDTYQKFVDKKLYVPELFNSWLEIISAWERENDEFKSRLTMLPVVNEEHSFNFLFEDIKTFFHRLIHKKLYPSHSRILTIIEKDYSKLEFLFGFYENYHIEDNFKYYHSLIHTENLPKEISFFLQRYAAWENFYYSIDPYLRNPLELQLNIVNEFLRSKISLSFNEFMSESNPKQITSFDYKSVIPKIRFRLFQYRAPLYIAVLNDCENANYNLSELVQKIQLSRHKYLMKMKDEPSWIIVNKRLGFS